MPQIVWVPVLIASAVTSTRWTLLVVAVSGATLAVWHAPVIAALGATPATSTVVILAIIVAGRMLHERLLEAVRSEQERSTRLSLFDTLTALPNRTLLIDRIHEGLKRTHRSSGKVLAVLIVDIDGFSDVNDSLGHQAGDQLLVEVARRIGRTVRASDTVARFGGDDFAIVVEVADRVVIDRIALAIQGSLAPDVEIGNERVTVRASIGIAVFPDDADTAEDLLKQADQALVLAKRDGGDRLSYFTRAMQETVETRRRLANDLREALALGQLEVHYQPIIELSTGRVHHAEALARWRHPTRGMVSPADFIPLAEATGLINEIGEWVFREACRHSLRWREASGSPFTVGVNRSPVQFRGGVERAAAWPAHMRTMGLPGDGLAVEITEGLLLNDRDDVDAQLASLRAAGIAVALDDFGTGYSALAYLQKYRFDFLKIDRAFVRELGTSSTNTPLCRAMITMAHDMGMKVVAEGVETTQQRDLLAGMGCDYAQGFLFARPMPAADFDVWLARA
jgi:diguanylate cyclase (GGDEF)-like protein